MKKWILFNLDHPKLIIALICIVTVISATGLLNLHFDSSTEAVMPKDSIAYRMGQRAKQVFIDSKTFMLTGIEPVAGKKLFSKEVFQHINKAVQEIEEFKDFNLYLENGRLDKLIKLGRVQIKSGRQKKKSEKSENFTQGKGEIENDLDAEFLGGGKEAEQNQGLESDLDAEFLSGENPAAEAAQDKIEDSLDAEFLGGGKAKSDNAGESTTHEPARDIWDLSKPLEEKNYAKPVRDRRNYDYGAYQPVPLSSLKDGLDKVGQFQLETILYLNDMHKLHDDHLLSKSEYKNILEKWEEAYLYKSMEIVKTFINPITGEDITGTEDTLKPVELVKEDESGVRQLPETADDFEEYKKILFGNPAFKSTLYSLDDSGHIRALAFTIAMKPQKDHSPIFIYLRELMEKYNHDPVIMTPAGTPVFEEYIKEYMNDDLQIFLPLVFIVVILTFYLNFRLLRGVVLPTLCLGLAIIWTMGLMGFMGIPITLVVNMLPSLLVAVASSYSIHIFNQYLHDHEALHTNDKKRELLVSMNHISITVMLAAFTTFIGFLTLTVNQITSLRDFGIFAAIGTMLAMAISVMLIPSALMMMKLIPLKEESDNTSGKSETNPAVKKIVGYFSRLSLNHSHAVVITVGIIFIISAIGLTLIDVETGPMYTFKEEDYPYQTEMRINELFEGTMVLNLIFDTGRKDGVKDPEFLKFIEDMRNWIVTPEGKKKYHQLQTAAFGDIIKRMHKAMNGDDPAFYRIPDRASVIRDYLEIFTGEDKDSDGRIDSMEQFIDRDYRYTNVMIRTGNYEGELYSTNVIEKGQERIRNYLENHPYGKKFKTYFVGEPVNMTVISNLIVQGQVISVFLTLIIVALIIFLLFRNIQAGVVAVIPISVSITIVYGAMGYFDIPLDIAKALLAALAIGIGVDDTIHMLKTLRHNIIKGLNLRAAMVASHNEAGVAIVYTSLALVFGFSVLLFSKFVPIMYLGLLVTATMIVTTISALLLLPSVIVLFRLPLDKELDWKILRWLNLNALFKLDEE